MTQEEFKKLNKKSSKILLIIIVITIALYITSTYSKDTTNKLFIGSGAVLGVGLLMGYAWGSNTYLVELEKEIK